MYICCWPRAPPFPDRDFHAHAYRKADPCSFCKADCKPSVVQVLMGDCCSRQGSCTSLRSGLANPGPDDLCNTDQNLCDVDGHLLHLALVHQARLC